MQNNVTVWDKRKLVTSSSRKATRCLKIPEKVSFNIASEASYVYIAVLPDRSWLKGQKLVKNAKIENATFLVIFKHCGLSYNKSLGFWLMMRCDQVCSILKIVAAQKSWRLTAYFTEWMMILLDLPSVTLSVDDDGSTAVP